MDTFKLAGDWNTCINIVIANILISAADVSVTWTSSASVKLSSNDTSINPLDHPITPAQDDVLGSILYVGAILGPFPFGIIANNFGRKKVLLLLAVPHIIAFFIMAIAGNIYFYYFARFLAGLSLGAGYYLVPLYVSEIAKSSHRGSMVAVTNIFWCIGNFSSLVIGSLTSFVNFNFILMSFPMIFIALFGVFGVESPYYLMGSNNERAAEKSLMVLRSDEEITEEMDSIKHFLRLNNDGKFLDMFKDRLLRKRLLIAMSVLVCLIFTGFWEISFHLELILESSGVNVSSDRSAIFVGAALLVSSFFSPILLNRFPRRPLVISSFIGMSLVLFILAAYFSFPKSDSLKWLPLFCLAAYLGIFNAGAAIVPWILLSELFPNKFKNAAGSYCTTLCWLLNFLLTLNFSNLNSVFGLSGIFLFFGTCCFIGAVLSYFVVPETKGKNFIDIQEMFTERSEENRNFL